MLSAPCPTCGRPALLSLAAPDVLRCASCGPGATSEDARAQLAAAERILRGVKTSQMQLSSRQQRALRSTRDQAIGYFTVVGLGVLPLFLCGGIGSVVALDRRDPSAAGVLAMFSPLIAFVAVGYVGYLVVKRRYRSLRIACAALPPEAPGQPAGCHVCGGPLPTTATAVARCGYCAADNVLDPAALTAAVQRRRAAFADFESVVRREATAAGAAVSHVTVPMIAAAITAPFVAIAVLFAATIVLWHMETSVDPAYRYGVVKTAAGSCIAHVSRRAEGRWLVSFGAHAPAGVTRDEERASVDDLPARTAKDFVGARVRAGRFKRPPAGVITRVHGSHFEGNEAVIDGDDYDLVGLCLDEKHPR